MSVKDINKVRRISLYFNEDDQRASYVYDLLQKKGRKKTKYIIDLVLSNLSFDNDEQVENKIQIINTDSQLNDSFNSNDTAEIISSNINVPDLSKPDLNNELNSGEIQINEDLNSYYNAFPEDDESASENDIFLAQIINGLNSFD